MVPPEAVPQLVDSSNVEVTRTSVLRLGVEVDASRTTMVTCLTGRLATPLTAEHVGAETVPPSVDPEIGQAQVTYESIRYDAPPELVVRVGVQ
jgi:hypothetical protein